MTPALLLARDCIIYWVNIWIAPIESAFDMIASELVRRGVELEGSGRLCSNLNDRRLCSPGTLHHIEVFDVVRVNSTTGRAVWTGLTGSRAALERDGFVIDRESMTYCPREWLDPRGYLDAELARKNLHARSICNETDAFHGRETTR